MKPAALTLPTFYWMRRPVRVSRAGSPEKFPPTNGPGARCFGIRTRTRLEVYVGADGNFYNLLGELITNIPPPAVVATDTVTYVLDPDTGQLTTLSHRKAIRWEIQRGFQMHADGTFWDISHSNQPPVQVTRGQAVRQQGP